MDVLVWIEKEIGIHREWIESVIHLLNEGNTIPFIARYRKEITGGLDEVQIEKIKELYEYRTSLEKEKETIKERLRKKGVLTEELEKRIEKVDKRIELEEIYKLYRSKKKTLAQEAREKGLEHLANKIALLSESLDIEKEIERELKENKNVKSREEIEQGVKEILKERVVNDKEIREVVKEEYQERGFIVSKVKDKEKDVDRVYEDYYDFREEVKKIPSHRLLAIKRGEREGILKVGYEVEREKIVRRMKEEWIKGKRTSVEGWIEEIVKESYRKSLKGSVEREVTEEVREVAETRAIEVFKENVENVLMQAPVKGKRVLGIDPAYRTGCKLAVVEKNGELLEIGFIYPHEPKRKWEESKEKLKEWIEKYGIEIIAIGNGTASRETEELVGEVIQEVDREVGYVIVNEAGASVYSASEVAREEFPDLKVEERSAVSIARRLMDPLAEWVKIDPRSWGVGQYQHDVDQEKLKKALDFVVEKVVNRVGVDVNTASVELLSYVSGLNKKIAKNIVEYRRENGLFRSREEVKKVKGIGKKVYEQCIGFLRVYDGENKLDETEIHPESYGEAERLLDYVGYKKEDIGREELKKALECLEVEKVVKELGISEEKVKELREGLMKPRRDIREERSGVLLRKDVMKLEDVKEGMELWGTIRNVVDFGVFVDIGVKRDGLIHRTKIGKNGVKHPSEVLKVGDVVKVVVEKVDIERGRISLQLKE